MAKRRRLGKGAIRLRCTQGSSNKFYDILLHPDPDENKRGAYYKPWCYTVHYGRVGATGSFQTKDFSDRRAAQAAYDKQLVAKSRGGYVDVTGEYCDSGDDLQVGAVTTKDVVRRKTAVVGEASKKAAKRRSLVRD